MYDGPDMTLFLEILVCEKVYSIHIELPFFRYEQYRLLVLPFPFSHTTVRMKDVTPGTSYL